MLKTQNKRPKSNESKLFLSEPRFSISILANGYKSKTNKLQVLIRDEDVFLLQINITY